MCSSAAAFFCRAPDRHYGNAGEWEVCRCGGCGHLFQWPLPDESDLARYYPEDYYAHQTPSTDLTPRGLRRRGVWLTMHYLKGRRGYNHLPVGSNRLLAFIAGRFFRKAGDLGTPSYVPGGRFLDFGCGSGDVVAFARFVGWKAEGIEISAAAVAAGRRAGLDLTHGSVEALEAVPGRYDYVFSSHCVEHIPDAARVFRAFHRALKPGGCLAVEVPNGDASALERFGAYYYYLGMPVHVHVFTPRSISILAESAGLESIDVVTHSRWVTQAESALLWIGGGGRRFHAHGRLSGVLGRVVAIPSTAASWRNGKGDCLVLNCRKPGRAGGEGRGRPCC